MTSFTHLRFHENFINIIKGVPLSFYDSLIRALLIIFPYELPDLPKSPYGWDFFARKIQATVKSQDSIDAIVRTRFFARNMLISYLKVEINGGLEHYGCCFYYDWRQQC